MESNHQDSIYPNDQEVDQPEQENNFGVGRSYECVFCRRGFNTAQALGGHMNIHRKDRARNKPITINTNKHHEENYKSPSFYQQNPSCSPQLVASHEAVQTEYRTDFPASTSSEQPFYANYHSIYDHNQQRLNPFGDDRCMRLSLPFGPGLVEDIGKSGRGGIQEEELDLELRLGP